MQTSKNRSLSQKQCNAGRQRITVGAQKHDL